MDDFISRSMVLGMFEHECCSECSGCKYEDKERVYPCGLIKSVPIVDAVPVVHGRWIKTTIPANTTGYGGVGQDKKKGWLCSECKCAFDAKLLWIKNYCPGCGAKMEFGGIDG